jgi:putative membrane protein
MLAILISIILSSLSVFVAAQILPGIHVSSYSTAVVVAIVLGFINTFIRPLLLILTLPINILTLGLFTLVIMALCVMLASAIVPGFFVANFWWAMAFALIFAILNAFLGGF